MVLLFLFVIYMITFCWFRKEALREADETLALPINLRNSTFEKMVHRLLVGTKYSLPQQGIEWMNLECQQERWNWLLFLGKEQVELSNHVSTDISTNEEQQSQVIYFSLEVRSNNHHKCYPLYAIYLNEQYQII